MIALFNTILRLSLAGGITCLALFVVSALLRDRLPKAWHHRLWLIVTVSFLVPVSFNLRLTIPQMSIPAAPVSSLSAAVDNAAETDLGGTPSAPKTVSTQPPAGQQAPTVPPVLSVDVSLVITVVWIVGTVGMLLWYIAGYCVTSGKLKKGRTPLISDSIPVYESVKITTPLLVGLFHPVIYLPKDFENAELAVRHELCHWLRGDLWIKWLVQLVVCIHWFNPLAHLMKREMNRLSELACDEAVVRDMDEEERRAYGQMLLDTLRLSSSLGGPMIAVMGNKKQWLRDRMLGIMSKRIVTPKSVVAIAVLVVCVVGTAVLAGGFASGCSTAGTASQKKPEPAVSASAVAATSAVSSPSVSDASPDISPSTNDTQKKIYVFDKDGNVEQMWDNLIEKTYPAASNRDANNLDDTEISRLLGYKVVFPEILGNGIEFERKSMGIYTGKKFDLATSENLSHALYIAIVNDTAFAQLSEYDPTRNCMVVYKNDKWNEIYLTISKTEYYNDFSTFSASGSNYDTVDIGSVKGYWDNYKLPIYSQTTINGETVADNTKPPTGIIDCSSLSWTTNGISYSINTYYNQYTLREAVDIAKAFMEAQGN